MVVRRVRGRTTAEVMIGILWWRSFASDREPAARYERDGMVKKDLGDARRKIEATVKLCNYRRLARHMTPPGEYVSLAPWLTFNFWRVNELGSLRGAAAWVPPRGWWASFVRLVRLCLFLVVVTICSVADVLMLATRCEAAKENRHTSTRIHCAKTSYACLLYNVGVRRRVSYVQPTSWRSRRTRRCFRSAPTSSFKR